VSIGELLFGKPLRSDEEESERIGVFTGVAVLGLDALASAAYGPEAALTVLIPAGPLASLYIVPITACILALLTAVFLSYYQTIAAYPDGGGSFTVAKQNLGRTPGLVAAAALCVDYIINVAVAISAGVGTIVSAVPSLLPYTLTLTLFILAFLTIVNLRGVRTAGVVFLAPTYAFVALLGGTLVIGLVNTFPWTAAHMHATAAHAAAAAHSAASQSATSAASASTHAAVSVVSLWLLMRAFASGCTAMTGVEAVSDAVPLFREPRVRLARSTLALIVFILAFLVTGVALLCRAYGITATEPGQPGYQSVLSLVVSAVIGSGAGYFLTMGSILMVLALSANTSFADFPRVCRMLALDAYLPPEFAHRGPRLVYTTGIVSLTLLAGGLLIAFGGITDRLIPLFAVGAFLAFTMSQLGMVMHWWRTPGSQPVRMSINAIGALATSIALGIIIVSKFAEGAWVTVLIIPGFVLLFMRSRQYHERLWAQTADEGPLDVSGFPRPLFVIPLRRLDRVARKALRFALGLSVDVHAVQVLAEELETEDLTRRWRDLVEEPARRAGYTPPTLVVLRSPYREFYGPFLNWIGQIANTYPDRHIVIVIPEIVHRRWYHFLLSHRETMLKTLLLLKGGPHVIVMNTPWYPDITPAAQPGPATVPQESLTGAPRSS
jgi:amino acid transporter